MKHQLLFLLTFASWHWERSMFLASYIPRGLLVELYCLHNAEISIFVPNEALICVRCCPKAGEGVFPMLALKLELFPADPTPHCSLGNRKYLVIYWHNLPGLECLRSLLLPQRPSQGNMHKQGKSGCPGTLVWTLLCSPELCIKRSKVLVSP